MAALRTNRKPFLRLHMHDNYITFVFFFGTFEGVETPSMIQKAAVHNRILWVVLQIYEKNQQFSFYIIVSLEMSDEPEKYSYMEQFFSHAHKKRRISQHVFFN